MAKDDMPVLFCKILIYLYKVLKGKQERDEYYIQPMTNDFPISETYLQTVLIELQEKRIHSQFALQNSIWSL